MDNFLIGYFVPCISSLRSKEEISSSTIEQLPSYAQFSEYIAKGEININDTDTQQKMGFIFLKMVEAEVQEVKF